MRLPSPMSVSRLKIDMERGARFKIVLWGRCFGLIPIRRFILSSVLPNHIYLSVSYPGSREAEKLPRIYIVDTFI